MADIATLGLAIDSRQAVSAKTALDGLKTAAGGAERATVGLEAAAAKAGPRLAQAGKDSELAGRRHGSAAASLSQLSFQINDIASGVAMGQSPFQILAQQGGQVYQIWQMNNQVFRQAGQLVIGFLTPMRMLGIAGAAVALAGYAINSAWQTSAQRLDDAAHAAGTTISQMRTLQQVASFKGIDADEFFKGFERFGRNVYDARAGMGGLAETFRANGVAAGDFNTSLERAANIIKNARDDQQRLALLQQMGLPATMEWVRLMSQGSAGIQRARELLGQVSSAEQELIDKARVFDQEWNAAWTEFKNDGIRAVVGIKAAWNDFYTWLRSLDSEQDQRLQGLSILAHRYRTGATGMDQGAADSFYGKFGSTFPKAVTGGDGAKDSAVVQHDNQLYIQKIGLLGQLATANEIVRAKEKELENAFLATGVSIGSRKQALLDLVRLQTEQSRASQATQFGIFNPGQYAEIQRLQLSTLISDGTIKSAQDYGAAVAVITKNIRDASEQAAIARSPFEQMTRYGLDAANTTKQLDQVGAGALSGLENGLAAIGTRTKSVKDAFKDMANSIISDLIRMTVRSTITGPLSGMLSGLFAGLGGGGGVLPGGTPLGQGGIPHRASGGPVTAGQPYIVGERGPELIVPRGNGTVISNDSLWKGRSAPVSNSGGSAPVVNNFIVENHAKADVQESQSRNSSGGIDHRVIIMQTVNEGMSSGKMDKSLRGRTGTRVPKVI